MTGQHRAAPGRHEAPPAPGTLVAEILAWEGRAAEHNRIAAGYRPEDHTNLEMIEHVNGQLAAAGQLISDARVLFLRAQHESDGPR